MSSTVLPVSTAPAMPKTGMSRLYIGNMVCPQCLRVVRRELEGLGLRVEHVVLGMVDVSTAAASLQAETIRRTLTAAGFTLLDDADACLVEQLKALVVELIHYTPRPQWPVVTLSVYLSSRLGRDYTYLSHLFSTREGLTLEKFVIRQKIERAKELLSYQDASIAQIADQLGYSSAAYLTNQFRQLTGLTPSEFQRMAPGTVPRRCLDNVI